MRLNYKAQDEYRSNMYQNISHDFKTPLTVIKSYIEAVNDGVEDKDEAFKVINEQTDKLEKKVYSLLYLNKLEYLKSDVNAKPKKIDIGEVINSSIDKFKFQRKDVKITASIDNSTFYGTFDLWETIIDNILNNFIRYADKEIKITVKKNVITLYNDGPKIDESLVNDMFTPFKKGLKGQFGLGLSIVKKTLNLLDYDITAENKKIGVSFIIKKQSKK
jgi:two-component system sensor histidine kinase CssS